MIDEINGTGEIDEMERLIRGSNPGETRRRLARAGGG